MRPSRIEVEIGELVLHGVPLDDVPGFQRSVEEHLAVLAAGATAPETSLGARVARAVWDRLPSGNDPARRAVEPHDGAERGEEAS